MSCLRRLALGSAIAPLLLAQQLPADAFVLTKPEGEALTITAAARKSAAKRPIPLPPERPAEIAAAAKPASMDEEAADATPGSTEPDELQVGEVQVGEVQAGEVQPDDAEAAASAEGFPFPRPRPAEAPSMDRVVGAGPVRVVDQATAAATKEALIHISAKRFDQALEIQKRLPDPAAAKLVEFYYVRDSALHAPYRRIAAFLTDNRDWPNRALIQRRFEVALLAQRAPAEVVLEAFADRAPLTTAGTIVLASALAASGESARANELARTLWRKEQMTEGEERLVAERFSDVLTREDHKARMDRLLDKGETSGALRAARKLGADEMKLAEARVAVIRRSKSAGAMLDKVPTALRQDPGYILAKTQWHRRLGRYSEAAKIIGTAQIDPAKIAGPDEWSLERRIIARELIELGDPAAAYAVVSQHGAESPIERLDSEWLAGWIALRFLHDTEKAEAHFAALTDIATTPISLARAEYWLGRTAEERGEAEEALRHYLEAGRYTTTYYGQLALARIGNAAISEPRKPLIADTAHRIVAKRDSMRAMRLLGQIGMESDAARFMISMAQEAQDAVTAVGVAETAHRMSLTSATVWIGKAAHQSGFPTELYAFATGGIPSYTDLGPGIEEAVVNAIARQESVFNAAAMSPAGARGLMQLMPATAQATARRYGQSYDLKRLTSDPSYNAKLGAAHLGDLTDDFGTAYALVFAAYNAGGGRVVDWIKRFGDPRKGEIDPVDWVELIPFSETRNYVQRVLEGVQVYRASLSGAEKLLIAQDLRIPIDTQTAIATAADGQAGDDGVPGVFSSFGGTELTTGSSTVPASALGFGGSR